MTRAAATLALVLVHLVGGLPGIVYLCNMDGQTRVHRCCPGAKHAKQTSDHATIASGECCQPALLTADRMPSTAREQGDHAVQAPVSIALWTLSPATTEVIATVVHDPATPRTGPPLFLKLRSLII